MRVYFACPECGERIGCKIYYDSQGFDPGDGLPPGAMGMMQRVGGEVDIAVGTTQGNTTITGGTTQIDASARVNGEQATKRLVAEKLAEERQRQKARR